MQVMAGYAGDKGWLLLAARMWVLDGRQMDVDFVEVNPPLIIWFYGLPVWLAKHIGGLADYQLLGIIGLVGSALSSFASARLIAHHPAFADNARAQRCFMFALFCMFVLLSTAIYFFDRDHVFYVLTFPYMLRFMPSLARQRLGLGLRVAVGLLGGLGFCMKPYTVVFFLALQLLVILREKSAAILWSIENALIYASGAFYLLCVWCFAHEYIAWIMPMAAQTYWAFSRREMAPFYAVLAFIMAGVVFVDFRFRDESPYRRDIPYFIGVAAGYFAYALAANGWGYSFHPLLCTLLFITVWLWLHQGWMLREQSEQDLPVKRFVFGRRACALSLGLNVVYMAYCIGGFFMTPTCEWYGECKKNLPYADYLSKHNFHSFGALSEDFHKWSALAFFTDASFDTRYNALWMVPAMVIKGEEYTREHQWILDYAGKGLARDLNVRRPPVVFVDDPKRFFGTTHDVSLATFFEQVPEFKEAWSHYRFASTIDRCEQERRGKHARATGCRYDLYERIP